MGEGVGCMSGFWEVWGYGCDVDCICGGICGGSDGSGVDVGGVII